LFVFVMLAACGEKTTQHRSAETEVTQASPETPGMETPATEETEVPRLVVYSGRGSVLVQPLFDRFTAKTGIQLDLRYADGTEALARRLVAEGSDTSADVFFAQDSGYLGSLAKANLLRELPESVVSRVSADYRGEGKRWVGVSGRARVLVYSPERVPGDQLPKTLFELADPRFKGRLGWAPSNASFQAHVSALRALWGEAKTKDWLSQMQALEPVVYPKNSPQVKAVSRGEIDIGWVNHYYLHKLRKADPSLKAANHSFPTRGDAGNVMMLSGVGITRASGHVKQAEQLVAFLLEEASQNYFAQEVFEHPTVAGVAGHKDVPSLRGVVAEVDQEALTDVGTTLSMLRALGIQ